VEVNKKLNIILIIVEKEIYKIEYSLSNAAFSATLSDFRSAANKVSGDVISTPCLPFKSATRIINLKAECLQPLGSFKIRAAANAIESADKNLLQDGIITASAGNFGQGIAQAGKNRGLPVHVFVPNTASHVKLDSLINLGATIEKISFEDWWQIMITRLTGRKGFFIHPGSELSVILGNGSIGLELFSQIPNVDTIIVPVGGGGMISGIALAMKALKKKNVRIIACEIESSTPLFSAKKAGKPIKVERGASWIDGIGSTGVLEEMWPLLDQLVDEVVVVSHSDAEIALRELALKSHLVSEGAGAVALAAALNPKFTGANVVSVISGGNIDITTYSQIINGTNL